MPEVPGRQELALLEVHGAARGGGGQQQVRLAAEEGRDLEHVHRLGHRGALVGLVHVRQHRHAQAAADLRQDVQPLLHGRAPVAGEAGPVGLVEAGLEDEGDAPALGQVQEAGSQEVGVLPAFDDAGPGDEEEALFRERPDEIHGTSACILPLPSLSGVSSVFWVIMHSVYWIHATPFPGGKR